MLSCGDEVKEGDTDQEGVEGEVNRIGLELFGEKQKGGPDNIAEDNEQISFDGKLNVIVTGDEWFKSDNKSANKGESQPFPLFGFYCFFKKK